MGLKVFRALMRTWCWMLIVVSLLGAAGSAAAVLVYIVNTGEMSVGDRIAAALLTLLFAVFFGWLMRCGLRLRNSLNGMLPDRSVASGTPSAAKAPHEPTRICSAGAEQVLGIRWNWNARTRNAEFRLQDGRIEILFCRDVYDNREKDAVRRFSEPEKMVRSTAQLQKFVCSRLEMNREEGSRAAKIICDFYNGYRRRAVQDRTDTEGKQAGLAERMRRNHEKVNAEGFSLCEMQTPFMERLFVPYAVPVQDGETEWIMADRRDNCAYYTIKRHEKIKGRMVWFYDVCEPISWAEVAEMARTTKNKFGKKYTRVNAENWRLCRELLKKTVTKGENSCTVTWYESLDFRRENSCRYREGQYELFDGGDNGPNDRMGFGTTKILTPADWASEQAFRECAGGMDDEAIIHLWNFVVRHQEMLIMRERGVKYPPLRMWAGGKPEYEHERYIELSLTGRPPYEYDQEALVKYSGGWFLHCEGAWRGGYSHSDGGSNDTYLMDVNDDNVEEYVRTRRKKRGGAEK